jgi:hypothetical protein
VLQIRASQYGGHHFGASNVKISEVLASICATPHIMFVLADVMIELRWQVYFLTRRMVLSAPDMPSD